MAAFDKAILEENRRRIIRYFESGARELQGPGTLGTEVEHFVIADDGRPVTYEPADGLIGIRDVLEHIERLYPEHTRNEQGDLLGLGGPEGTVTLEPAAQIEVSVAPHVAVADVMAGYRLFRERVDPYLAKHGARLLSVGYHPTRRARELALIPKSRYDFMDRYFAHIGLHGERMMRASASTQVSVDFSSERDAVRKLRVASALAPVLTAIADNTRVFEAEANHVPLARLRLWRDVDNARCGTIPNVFSDGFGFGDYADWLLGTPPIFVTRPPVRGTSPSRVREAFDLPSSLMYADAPMGTQDIEHLVSMFWPDARLKRFVEIRPADALPEQGVAGYTALIKGLFYFESSLRAVEDALGVEGGSWRLRAADVEKAIVSVNRRGFGGVLYGLPLSEWEDLLFSQARQALDDNEGRLLDWLEGFAHDKDWWQTGERP